MKIKFIIGEAGTAKTTNIVNIAKEIKHDFIALAFTHSACNNMIEKGMPVNKVKTLHSYFRIMPDTTFINLPKHIPKFIIIDEFSLIPVDLIENIFNKLECFETTLILSGDLLQLPPVADNSFKIDNLNLNGECSLNDAKKIFMTLGRTILNSSYYLQSSKMLLTKNFRCGDNVMKTLNEILETETVQLTELDKVSSDCVFIASTYKNLKKIRKSKGVNFGKVITRVGKCETDDNFILTKNLNENFFNGDNVKIICFNDDECEIYNLHNSQKAILKRDKYFDLLPCNYLTIHYAQGRGFENVCLCVDDLFEIGMLYTGITRAKKNIYFISLINSVNVDCSDIIRPFKIMKKNIY